MLANAFKLQRSYVSFVLHFPCLFFVLSSVFFVCLLNYCFSVSADGGLSHGGVLGQAQNREA